MKIVLRSWSALLYAVGAMTLSSTAGAEDAASPTKPTNRNPAPVPAVHAALKRTEASAVIDLTRSAAAPDRAGLEVGSGGAPVEVRQGRLSIITGTTSAQATGSAVGTRTVVAPTPGGAPAPVVGRPRRTTRSASTPVPDSERVVLAMGPSFASCRGKGDAGAPGPAVISANIGPDGEVAGTKVVTSGGMTEGAVACFRDVVAHAKFGSVGARGAVLQIRINPQELAPVEAPTASAEGAKP